MNQNHLHGPNFGKHSRTRLWIAALVFAGIFIILILVLRTLAANKNSNQRLFPAASTSEAQTKGPDGSEAVLPSGETPEETQEDKLVLLLSGAQALSDGYDYDGALELLKSEPSLSENEQILSAIADCEATKETLVRINPQEVTHVFFHSLIMDTSKAFDGDSKEAGYNQVMTTKSEFLKIMESMYEKGYVLVIIHDLAYETTGENGYPKFVYGNIYLPEGKKAFVLSQDDVCYYEYMKEDGFASRIVIGEDGYPTCEMVLDDGSVTTGDYDYLGAHD